MNGSKKRWILKVWTPKEEVEVVASIIFTSFLQIKSRLRSLSAISFNRTTGTSENICHNFCLLVASKKNNAGQEAM